MPPVLGDTLSHFPLGGVIKYYYITQYNSGIIKDYYCINNTIVNSMKSEQALNTKLLQQDASCKCFKFAYH